MEGRNIPIPPQICGFLSGLNSMSPIPTNKTQDSLSSIIKPQKRICSEVSLIDPVFSPSNMKSENSFQPQISDFGSQGTSSTRRKKTDSTNDLCKLASLCDPESCDNFLECHETIWSDNINNDKEDTTVKIPEENKDFSIKNEFTNDLLSDIIKNAQEKEKHYSIDPFYLDRHPEINNKMIVVLIDWMMEVCAEFHLSRNTFHYSVHYVHQYMNETKELPRVQLQLLGLTSLYIASKFEEVYIPKIQEFAKAAADGYTIDQIQEMEKSIVTIINWKFSPPTLSFWANYILNQWDLFIINNTDTTFMHIAFKEKNNDSYIRFCHFFHLIDLINMDIKSLQYNKQILACAVLYILLIIQYGAYTFTEILQIFPNSSKFLFENNQINTHFNEFCKKFIHIDLNELLPGIQYVANYIDMPFECEIPVSGVSELNGSYEEYLNTQTFNKNQCMFLKYKISISHHT